MSKEILVIAMGVWVAIIPYLGVPGSWRTVILIISGLLVILIGFLLRAESLSRVSRHSQHHTFVENAEASHSGGREHAHGNTEERTGSHD